MSHPIQPLYDDSGTVRFQSNAIVRYLLDHGGIDLNALACLTFSDEDWQQFAQLIGYSLNGYGELSYVSDVAYSAAATAHERGLTPDEARVQVLSETIRILREQLKAPMALLFDKHPDDFGAES